MSLQNYAALSAWMGRYSSEHICVSPDVASIPEGQSALLALNQLADLLKRGDRKAMEDLFKMRQRDEWLRNHHCADDASEEFYDIPQTD